MHPNVLFLSQLPVVIYVFTILFHWGLFNFKLNHNQKNVNAKRTGRCVIVYIVTAVECFLTQILGKGDFDIYQEKRHGINVLPAATADAFTLQTYRRSLKQNSFTVCEFKPRGQKQ